MKTKLLDWFAILLILETGLIHMIMAQGEYDMAPYAGYLFAAHFFGALVSAFGIYHKQFWGWALGFVVSAGSIAAYIWSRTLGLPGMESHVMEWFTPYAVVSKSLEGVFVLLFLLRPWKIPTSEFLPFSVNSRSRYILPVLGLFLITSASVLTYRWDYAFTQAFGHHIGSLAQVSNTPVMTFAQLEEQYGVQVSLVANSMMNSIVDVRLKIIDPDKAHALLQNQAALLVDQQVLVLAPHMHHHAGTKLNKIYLIFFPTQNKTIHPGSSVNLVFGSVRVEPVVVR